MDASKQPLPELSKTLKNRRTFTLFTIFLCDKDPCSIKLQAITVSNYKEPSLLSEAIFVNPRTRWENLVQVSGEASRLKRGAFGQERLAELYEFLPPSSGIYTKGHTLSSLQSIDEG